VLVEQKSSYCRASNSKNVSGAHCKSSKIYERPHCALKSISSKCLVYGVVASFFSFVFTIRSFFNRRESSSLAKKNWKARQLPSYPNSKDYEKDSRPN